MVHWAPCSCGMGFFQGKNLKTPSTPKPMRARRGVSQEDELKASPRHFAELLDLSPEWVEGVLDDGYVRSAADPAERSARGAFRALILATLRRMDGALGQQLARNRRMARSLRRLLEEELQVELPRGDSGGTRPAAGGPGGDEPGGGARWRRRGVWLRRRRSPGGEAEPLEALGANAVYLGGPGSGVQVQLAWSPSPDMGLLMPAAAGLRAPT